MIKVESLTKLFGHKQAVNDVSFEVRRGEVLGFIGPNGAGKSTTMRIITGYLPASSGRVLIDGIDMAEQPLLAKAKIGYLPESAPLYNHKTVWEFLSFTAEIRGFQGAEKKARIEDAVNKCFLQPVLHQSIDTLSKGYKHRTCFAQAILHDPDILILDEPTDGLDPNQKREVRQLIKKMGENKAIIISTHILEEVEAVANKVVLISDGRKVFEGQSSELRQQSRLAQTVKLSVENVDSKTVGKALRDLSGCKEVTILEQGCWVHPVADLNSCSRQILDLVASKQWKIKDFGIEKGALDEVFYQLTNGGKESAK